MTEPRRTLADRLTEVETVVRLHVKSCDRKGTIQIGLLIAVLGALLSGMGVHFLH